MYCLRCDGRRGIYTFAGLIACSVCGASGVVTDSDLKRIEGRFYRSAERSRRGVSRSLLASVLGVTYEDLEEYEHGAADSKLIDSRYVTALDSIDYVNLLAEKGIEEEPVITVKGKFRSRLVRASLAFTCEHVLLVEMRNLSEAGGKPLPALWCKHPSFVYEGDKEGFRFRLEAWALDETKKYNRYALLQEDLLLSAGFEKVCFSVDDWNREGM